MLKVLGTELDFDITSPTDLDRYLAACDKMAQAGARLPAPPEAQTPAAGQDALEWTRAYRHWVAANCELVTNWIDDIFGVGAANRLLGPKTSLSEILNTYDALEAAITEQGEAVGARLRQFAPNRATRRGNKGQTS